MPESVCAIFTRLGTLIDMTVQWAEGKTGLFFGVGGGEGVGVMVVVDDTNTPP